VSPSTHFIASWLVAAATTDNARDRKLITLAGVLPDLDGLGMVVDVAGRFIKGNDDSFNYYHRYHHYLTHGWPGALVICGILTLFARRKPRTALLCLLTFHLHLLCDLIGSRGPGPDDFWPILYSKPLFRNPVWIWHGQWQLYGWQNGVIFIALFVLALWVSAKKGFSFLEMFGRPVDSTFVKMLRKCLPAVKTRNVAREQ
jgi:inner membrane protein